MSIDGANITKLRNFEMTPMIVTNLNLPPEIRYRNENILLCLLIPGPKKHGLLDTFLYPFVEEMKALDAGIPNIYNSYTDSSFSLHAWLLFVSGDGPASAEGNTRECYKSLPPMSD